MSSPFRSACYLLLLFWIFAIVECSDTPDEGDCRDGCGDTGKCVNGRCRCSGGYTGPSCGSPRCSSGCGNGQCTGPNQCTCEQGYSGTRCRMMDCPGGCVSGECTGPNQCTCQQGYSGHRCEMLDCPGGCVSGECTGANQCSCQPGYSGHRCETHIGMASSSPILNNVMASASTSTSTKQVLSDIIISVELKCGYSPADATDVREYGCFWKHPDGTHIQIRDIHDNLHPEIRRPDNTTENQCGIVLNSVTTEDVGTWTCVIPLRGRTLSATTELTFQTHTGYFNGNKANLIIIGLGLLVVILFLALIFTCLCCRKAPQNNQKLDMAPILDPQQRNKSLNIYDEIDPNWAKSQTSRM